MKNRVGPEFDEDQFDIAEDMALGGEGSEPLPIETEESDDALEDEEG